MAILRIVEALNTSVNFLLGNSRENSNTQQTDTDIKFAVISDPNVTDAQFDEIKKLARLIRDRDRK
jgi:hypothetical protein